MSSGALLGKLFNVAGATTNVTTSNDVRNTAAVLIPVTGSTKHAGTICSKVLQIYFTVVTQTYRDVVLV